MSHIEVKINNETFTFAKHYGTVENYIATTEQAIETMQAMKPSKKRGAWLERDVEEVARYYKALVD